MRRKTSRSRSREVVELLRRRGPRHPGELLDHAPRDRGREKRVAGGDRADRGDQLLGRIVLEDEAAGAGSERLVDVLVEVERREDQDPRAAVGGEDAPGRLEPVELGHPDVHQDDGRVEAGRPSRSPRARCSPRRRPRCPPRPRAACESRRGPSTGRRRRGPGWSSAVAAEREARAEDEAAAVGRSRASSRRRRS